MSLDERLRTRLRAEAAAVPPPPAPLPLQPRRRWSLRPALLAGSAAMVVLGAVGIGALLLSDQGDPNRDLAPVGLAPPVATTLSAASTTTAAPPATGAPETTQAATTVTSSITTTRPPTRTTADRQSGVVHDADSPLIISVLNVGGAPGPPLFSLTIANRSEAAVELSGWAIQDARGATHRFELPKRSLDAGASLMVWYGYIGVEPCDLEDGLRVIYWCSRDPDGDGRVASPWNYGSDTAQLVAPDGTVVSSWSY